ncbi:acyl-CoA synthetase [Virgisporangium aliadipatigenens]|uniref:Acyl-CoA synthetase n=1 Tax=Virgisporangium aliadipatigenens TaxID=741659 RepID=A0A8J3YEP3_9ACTN|nr:fatty acyl-AMP ligase [Virgisporangium aliadipatigenens]GIJ43636.1 acyl-CoA synthetase [Virgisporangium aliadipatigenens]
MIDAPHDVTDLGQLLRRRAVAQPDRVACQHVGIEDRITERLTYADLHRRALAVAAQLITMTEPGDRVLLLHPSGVDFTAALFGCFYAGVTAVPAPLPQQGERAIAHLAALADDARPALTVTTAAVAAQLGGRAPAAFGPVVVAADTYDVAPLYRRCDVAVLQYTSGSTGVPRGVLITHKNYLHNLRMLTDFTHALAPQPAHLRTVSWLPHFHDMGLALMMYTALHGGTMTLIPPMAFLLRPFVWLRVVSAVGGTLTAAPNFAFDQCVRKVTAEQRDTLDLRTLSVVLNAAEPVRPRTLAQFAAHFGPSGFRAEAFAPCFGLAEGTVFVSGLRHGGTPRVVSFDRRGLQDGVAVPNADPGASRALVGCGHRPEGLTVRIVDPTHHAERAPGEVGEIWVQGPSVGMGYWRRPAETTATFGGRLAGFDERLYLRTGDLGFLREGELFIVGRLADVITVDGRSVHPQDVEYTVQGSDPAFEGRRCVAVAHGAAQRLAVAVEVRVAFPLEESRREALAATVRAAVAAEHGVDVADVLLLPVGALPVTTSGKVRRAACRELLLAGAATVH